MIWLGAGLAHAGDVPGACTKYEWAAGDSPALVHEKLDALDHDGAGAACADTRADLVRRLPVSDPEGSAYEKAQEAGTRKAYEAFLALYPDGSHAAAAREWLARHPPPPPPPPVPARRQPPLPVPPTPAPRPDPAPELAPAPRPVPAPAPSRATALRGWFVHVDATGLVLLIQSGGAHIEWRRDQIALSAGLGLGYYGWPKIYKTASADLQVHYFVGTAHGIELALGGGPIWTWDDGGGAPSAGGWPSVFVGYRRHRAGGGMFRVGLGTELGAAGLVIGAGHQLP